MKVLVIGGGGREHALVWKLSGSAEAKEIYCIPGNGGICNLAGCSNIPLSDFQTLAQFVREKEIDFTVVGPEQPLVEGIVDYFQANHLTVFGPNRAASQMEGSKVFSKQLMKKYGIPTAAFETFDNYSNASEFLSAQPEGPVVVKADGLAAGKGSIVCPDKHTAQQALSSIMADKIFKEAGSRVVIEEFMTGEEASLFVVTDGSDYVVLTPAQDYKRALDGDGGKNTGGMGSYAPTPFLTDQLYRQAIREVIEPTLSALQSEGIDYSGVLYCGLMLTPEGPRVVEFNCRFGDPETQVVLPLLKSDLLELLLAVHHRELGKVKIENSSEHAVCVVMASGGYPGKYETGKEISGLEKIPGDVLLFHAGTRREDSRLLTSGGRVMGVTAVGGTLKEAAGKAYTAVENIHFENSHFRRDISVKAWE